MSLMPRLLFALVVCCAVGCGDGTQPVTGKVTLDGAPLPEGRIAFVSDASAGGGSTEIKGGDYTLRAPAGSYTVQITAEKTGPLPAGQVGMFGKTEGTYQYLPDRYNVKTELKASVPATSPLNFELKSN